MASTPRFLAIIQSPAIAGVKPQQAETEYGAFDVTLAGGSCSRGHAPRIAEAATAVIEIASPGEIREPHSN
jgi:hypothetical protein